MKLIGAIAALLLSQSLLAQDYKVTRFEASDYRTFLPEEMTAMIGENAVLLPELKCNGRDELDPFHKPLRMNPLRNSLQIKAAKSEARRALPQPRRTRPRCRSQSRGRRCRKAAGAGGVDRRGAIAPGPLGVTVGYRSLAPPATWPIQ